MTLSMRDRVFACSTVVATMVATVVVVVVAGIGAPAEAVHDRTSVSDRHGARLAAGLRHAIVDQHFDEVLDTLPPGSAASTRATAHRDDGYEATPGQLTRGLGAAAPVRIHQTPNLDVAVIELRANGRARAAADVLLSPQYPDGKVVPLDKNLSTDQVRWRRWDDAEWDDNHGRGTVDAVPGRANAPIDFMSPYPASVLKLMVGFGILQLVDRGAIALDESYRFDPTGAPNDYCGGIVTKPIRRFFDEMITVSKNESTCALIKLLHDHDAMDPLNQEFQDLGLSMLQLVGTRTVDGGHWADSQMSALDTAKLLMIINGGRGTLWTRPNGTAVTSALLSDASRQFFRRELAEQGLNQVLSTTNWCGRSYPAPGIPQLTPTRWIDPADGTVTVDGRVYGQDVRPCQAAAEVLYLHKTGLTDTSGNDAGIVRSLPGKPRRNYIVVVHANLGDRYIDANRPADPPGVYPVAYTEKYGRLGRAIDHLVTCDSAP
ncbi:MAG: hypothetical protein JWM15_2987 [Cryptosporangiaceae bacterium]|jgi:hypothetical protein|nr:hypothetical protein [Cryptosporangiaceae bacterium]